MPPTVTASAPPYRIRYLETIPFVLAHFACLGAIWTGVGLSDLALFFAFYAIRMFGITAGYHRYFAHRSFKTGRVFAFVLAFIAQSSAQRGILWWAANHRRHHRFSDTDADVHSPARHGFWYAHVLWFFTDAHDPTEFDEVPDLAVHPELVWLDRHPYFPALAMGFAVWLAAGWSGLVVGFLWSTVALWHATFSINSVAHVLGRQRYVTADDSRNNWWLALLTFGEGWHNNHHHFQSAARQGFRWYEVDFTYYGLKALAAVRLVRDLQRPPRAVVRSENRLRRAVVERAAGQLAASFQVEQIAAEIQTTLAEKRANLAGFIEDLGHQFDERVENARRELDEFIATVHLPAMPTLADLRARAAAMFARTASMNEIVERSRQMLIDDVLEELLSSNAVSAPARA